MKKWWFSVIFQSFFNAQDIGSGIKTHYPRHVRGIWDAIRQLEYDLNILGRYWRPVDFDQNPLYSNFTTFTSQIWKIVIFDDFSNFLQNLRYWFGYQNTLPRTYLRGLRHNLIVRRRLLRFEVTWEIGGLGSKSFFTAVSPLLPFKYENNDFRWFFKLSSRPKRLVRISKHIASDIFGAIETPCDAQNTIWIFWDGTGDQSILLSMQKQWFLMILQTFFKV